MASISSELAVLDYAAPVCVPPSMEDSVIEEHGQQASQSSYACVIERSPIPLITTLRWIDVALASNATAGTAKALKDAELGQIRLCLQEYAGIYWEEAAAGDIKENLHTKESITLIYSQIEDKNGQFVLSIPIYSIIGLSGHFAVWDGRDKRGKFVKPGKYQLSLKVGASCFWDQAWTPELEVIGDPYKIVIIATPKNDDDINAAIREANSAASNTNRILRNDTSPINQYGEKIMRDCWVDIWRGGGPHDLGAVKVHRDSFHGHIEPTAESSISTPKRDYAGASITHNLGGTRPYHDNVGSVGLREPGVTQGSEKLHISILQPKPPKQDTPYFYKSLVEFHTGGAYWTSPGMSKGCPTIASGSLPLNRVPYGNGYIDFNTTPYTLHPFRPIQNRQITPNYTANNSDNFLSCLFGSYSLQDIIKELKYDIRLETPVRDSLYDKIHRRPLAFIRSQFNFVTGGPIALFIFSSYLIHARSVLKRVSQQNPDGTYGSEDLVVGVRRESGVPYVQIEQPTLRYAVGNGFERYTLEEDQYDVSHAANNSIYKLTIYYDNLPADRKADIHNAIGQNQVYLNLYVRFAWNWPSYTWPTGSWPGSNDIPPPPSYLPNLDANGRRMDLDLEEYEFPFTGIIPVV
ncbi:MAG: hypothetical protein AB7H86_01100 [Blastocatellales bacterium]